MKIHLGILFVAASFAGASHANDAKHPCHAVKTACEAAGFVAHGHKTGKGLYKDCMQPLMAGQTVAGVTVNATDVEACKTKKAEHKK